ncbi:MAG: HEAT repeat domain-containing protein [Firmicutes bacterium]|nr:HEAT repeat domain-containing protein [Bacillota bacterium]
MIPNADKKIIDQIQEQAETFVKLAERKYRVKLDYSEEALVLTDDLVTIFLKLHKEHYIKAAVFLGSYLGETIIRNLGGKWLKDYSIKKVGKVKGNAHPITRARKRLANGTEDSLVTYYRNLKISNCKDAAFATDRAKLDAYGDILLEDGLHLELLERIKDPSLYRYVREEAAELFGRLVKDDMNEEIMKLASDRDLVYYSAIALQGHPVSEAYEPLIRQLKTNNTFQFKQQILLALGKIGNPEAISDISQFLDNKDELVGHFAAIALGKIGTDKAVENLLSIMAGSKTPPKLHAITAMEIMADNRTVPALVEALFSNDEEIREAAARALQYIPDERAFQPLLNCLSDRSSRLRIYAAYALAGIGKPEALPHIKKLLTDDVQTVRLHANNLVRWLKEGGLPKAKVI